MIFFRFERSSTCCLPLHFNTVKTPLFEILWLRILQCFTIYWYEYFYSKSSITQPFIHLSIFGAIFKITLSFYIHIQRTTQQLSRRLFLQIRTLIRTVYGKCNHKIVSIQSVTLCIYLLCTIEHCVSLPEHKILVFEGKRTDCAGPWKASNYSHL